jgi:hypothetical protein
MQLEQETGQKFTRDDALWRYQFRHFRQRWEEKPESEWLLEKPLDSGMQMVHSPLSVVTMAELLLSDAYAESDEEEAS